MLNTNLLIRLPLVGWNIGGCSDIFIQIQKLALPETIFIMARFTRSSRFTGIVIAVAFMVGLVINLPTSVKAQSTSLGSQLESSFRPPRSDSPAPENREGGATRSPCIRGDKPLVALVPVSGVGNTASDSPTVFWYMPELSPEDAPAPVIEFLLRDANKQEVYSTKYQLAKTASGVVGSPGLMSLNVSNIYPLKINQEYHWELTLMCDAKSPDRSQDTFVEGAVKRIEANPATTLRLQRATPLERVGIYARELYWYDTLATLVQLRRDRPTDPILADAWAKLFDSVNLNTISKEPLFQGVRNLSTNNQ